MGSHTSYEVMLIMGSHTSYEVMLVVGSHTSYEVMLIMGSHTWEATPPIRCTLTCFRSNT